MNKILLLNFPHFFPHDTTEDKDTRQLKKGKTKDQMSAVIDHSSTQTLVFNTIVHENTFF